MQARIRKDLWLIWTDVAAGVVRLLMRVYPALADKLAANGVKVSGAPSNSPLAPLFLGLRSVDKAAASEATLRDISVAVNDITAVALEEARAILSHRRVELDQGVELLLMHEAITSADFPALLTPAQPVPPPLAPIMSQFSRRT